MTEQPQTAADLLAGDERTRWSLGCAALVVLRFAGYAPALDGDFVWDDDTYLLDDPVLEQNGLYEVWLTPPQRINYWPVTFTTYWIEYQLWGYGQYRVRAAFALIGELARRPLEPHECSALRPLLAPALLEQAAEAVAARGGSLEGEIGPLLRDDLPRPASHAARIGPLLPPDTGPAASGGDGRARALLRVAEAAAAPL